MRRTLTSRSSLEALRKEAKRWLREIRDGDADARSRFAATHPNAPGDPGLRDVQLALAREYGFDGWAALKQEVDRLAREAPATRAAAIQALLGAADKGDADAVARLLRDWPDIVNERAVLPGHSGLRTALHFATNSMSKPVLDVLLAHGADPNVRDEGDNAFPIHFAAEKGGLEIVRTLVEHGSDTVGAGDHHELEVIGWATCFADVHRDVAEYLLQHGARHTIFSAVAMGDVDAIRASVARTRGDLDRSMDRTNHRNRPLHLAVTKDHPNSVAALIELGADLESRNEAGLTPLDVAALEGRSECARLLIDAGARIGFPAAVGLNRAEDVARLLAEDPWCLRPGGKWDRLIIRAAERSSGDVIEELIRAGASVHVRDTARTSVDGTHGYTALHAAAFLGNESAVRALLRHGASPADREDKYQGTPAGWADHAGHTAVRDLILDGPIDIFDAILFDRPARIREILRSDPDARDRPFQRYVNADAGEEGKRTPLEAAVALKRDEAARILREHGADERGARVARFLRWACQDWRTNGDEKVFRMKDAGRLLEADPTLARHDIFTAVATGDLEHVRAILRRRPSAAMEQGGPYNWPPLLYLCAARLPHAQAADNAVEIAKLLLANGADPNAFSPGGNADIHYTAFTWVMGRGEDIALVHSRAPELVALLLESGADPHDNQVLYNVFADNTSRYLLGEDMLWLLELMYEHSVRRGFRHLWDDPTWPMLSMRGAPSLGDEASVHHGAHFMLTAAVDRNLLRMAEWMLSHGADPNCPSGTRRGDWHSPHEHAMRKGYREMARLLERYGAQVTTPALDEHGRYVEAVLALDRARVREAHERHPEYRRDHRAMWAAIHADKADAVRVLVELGVSPDIASAPGGARALHMAASNASLGALRALIDAGADVDARENGYDGSALTWASHFGQRDAIEVLAPHARDIWHLVYTGCAKRVRQLVQEHPELARTVGKSGWTPLMWLPDDEDAAAEITSVFLAHGADPSVRNPEGDSAEDIAQRRGMLRVAQLLSSAADGARPHASPSAKP